MNEPSSIALMNLVAGSLVFFAAIIPLSYGIWCRAKETNSTHKVKVIVLSICSLTLYFIGLLWGLYNGPDLTVVFLFLVAFIFYTQLFQAQEPSVDRVSIVNLVL